MQDELGGKVTAASQRLLYWEQRNNYSTDGNDEKERKRHKNCLEAAQLKNKINQVEKHKEYHRRGNHKKFRKNNKLLLKSL